MEPTTEEQQPPQQPQVTPTQKVYCCSNYPQTEATLIAKFDLFLDAVGLLSSIIYIAVVSSTPDLIANTHGNQPPQNQSVATDVNYFVYWSREAQITSLALSIVRNIVGIGFTVLLLIGVKRKNHAYLLVWFIYTIVTLFISIIGSVVLIVLASDKVLISVLAVVRGLYNWYCLWIVKLLMSEIRGVREGYENPLEDGEIDHANNLMPSSDSFTVGKF